jgi:hypothetical protein
VKVRGTSGVPRNRESSSRTRQSASVNIRAYAPLDAICSMSRMSMAPQRNLSLTEELEKLEQSITLTLQGKHSHEHPAIATDTSRNRPELQPSTPHRNNRHSPDSRAVRKTLGSCLGGLQVLETILRGQRQCVTLGLRSPRARRISCTRRD